MILLTSALLAELHAMAEAAYPNECCALLVGHRRSAAVTELTEIHPSPNLATTPAQAFEIDPRLRLALQRRLRGVGGPRGGGAGEGSRAEVIGIHHSHPNHPAQPSARDLAGAWEPELIWLITAVEAGRATETNAFGLVPQPKSGALRFEPMTIRMTSA